MFLKNNDVYRCIKNIVTIEIDFFRSFNIILFSFFPVYEEIIQRNKSDTFTRQFVIDCIKLV